MTAEASISEVVASRNKSTTYLLPLLGKYVDMSYSSYVINTYIKFDKDLGVDCPIGVLYNMNEFLSFEEACYYNNTISDNPLFLRSFDMDGMRTLYVFKFPEEFIPEYTMFKEGKYSQFSKKAKEAIIAYSVSEYKYHPLIQDIAGILWKKKERREKLERLLGMSIPEDLELSSIMDEEKETFNIIINE